MKLLVFDNYDSFTYNIVHALRGMGVEPEVVRNDKITVEDMGVFDKIIISPGPGIPEEAGVLLPMLDRWKSEKPILGVCLGHQAIAQSFGGGIFNLPEVYHGISSEIKIIDPSDYLFNGIEEPFNVGRYHSWAVDASSLTDELEVTAIDDKGIVMALRHKSYDIRGVQFHPESVLTPQGERLLKNWLDH